MPIFEYKCKSCSSVFESFSTIKDKITCIFCDETNIERVRKSFFSPNKGFCKKNNKALIKKRDIRSSLLDLLGENDLKCYIKHK